MSTRKRRAPGVSPQAPTQTYPQDMAMPSDPYLASWDDTTLNPDLSAFHDPTLYDTYGAALASAARGHSRVVSLDGQLNGTETNGGQLVRRNPNHQLTPTTRRNGWDNFGAANEGPPWEAVDDTIEDLEQKAALAKKDAQAKRKQIPPFVQKLSSFLDNNKNENLIRWADDGNSFIVLDEDEFARTLIPELFKHNNYASFVRQLNMYGFHKKVGLSDNSMKASETKAKAPSEYYNKYFKRGRPELLWLIQKPKNPPNGPKRKRDESNKEDSDEDRKYIQDSSGGGGGSSGGYIEELAVRNHEPMAMIPRSEYNSLRVEVRELQQQQKLISNVLTQIKRQNEELYSRATSFQALHDRHEHSINAILTFLATFYNRSLEGDTNGLNLTDMFPASRQQPHGNVVDVDDLPSQEMHRSPQLQRSKRPLAILPAPPPPPVPTSQDVLSSLNTGRATTMSPSTRPTPTPLARSGSRSSFFKPSQPASHHAAAAPTRDSASTQPVKSETPSSLSALIENSEIISAIQSANASANTTTAPQDNSTPFDYAATLANYQPADRQVPLTTQQRADVLSSMTSSTSTAHNNNNTINNALTNHPPPPPTDLSNLLNDLVQYQATQTQLEMLQKLSDEQNSRIQDIQERVLPLSPSGQIPGINDRAQENGTGGGYFGNGTLGEPGSYDLDFDNLVQDQDFYPNGDETNGGVVEGVAAGTTAATPTCTNPPPDFPFDTSTPFDDTSVKPLAKDGGDDHDDSAAATTTDKNATTTTPNHTNANSFLFSDVLHNTPAHSDSVLSGRPCPSHPFPDTDETEPPASHLRLPIGLDPYSPGPSKVDSMASSNATSPAATVEEVEDETRRGLGVGLGKGKDGCRVGGTAATPSSEPSPKRRRR